MTPTVKLSLVERKAAIVRSAFDEIRKDAIEECANRVQKMANHEEMHSSDWTHSSDWRRIRARALRQAEDMLRSLKSKPEENRP